MLPLYDFQNQRKTPPEDCHSILTKLRGLLDLGNYDIEGEFQRFDPQNKGLVPASFFRQVVWRAARGLKITTDDLNLITDMCTARYYNLVDYRYFIDLLFKNQRHEPQPLIQVDLYRDYTLPTDPLNKFRDEYSKYIMDEINARLIFLGLSFENIFVTHPELFHNANLIHASMLYDILHKVGIYISEKDFVAFASRYQVGCTFLHKKLLFKDFKKSELSLTPEHLNRLRGDKIFRRMTIPFSSLARPHDKRINPLQVDNLKVITDHLFFKELYQNKKDDVYTIVSRIQKHIFINSLCPTMFFKIHDKDNDDKLDRVTFFKALESMGVSRTRPGAHVLLFRQDELEDLADAYTPIGKEDKVHWRRLVQDLESVYAPKEVEKKPNLVHALAPCYNPAESVRYLENRHNFGGDLSPEEREKLQAIVYKMKIQMDEYHMKVDHFFRGYDRWNHGYIEHPQFIRAMTNANFFLTLDEADLLLKFFADEKGFRYPRFVKIFEENDYQNVTHNIIWDNKIPNVPKKIERIPDIPVPNEKDDLYGVLEKVWDSLVQHKFKFRYFFDQYDKPKKFWFTRPQFIRAMVNTYDFPLTLKEYNILMDAFCDLFDKDKIYYKDFIRVVEQAEYFRELEQNPLLFPLPHIANRYRREFKYNKQEMDAFRDMWRKISLRMRGYRQWEIARGAIIETHTKKDKRTIKKVDYRRLLSLMNIEDLLTEYEVELLFDAYKIDVGRETKWDLEYFMRSADQMYMKTFKVY